MILTGLPATAATVQPTETAQQLNELALRNIDLGRYVAAEPLLKRALAIDERLRGRNHQLTAITLNNLGELFRLQGRFPEAEIAYRRAVAIDAQALGQDHPDYAADLSNLAALYLETGRITHARALLRRALDVTERKLGSHHPRVSPMLRDLAKSYMGQGRTSQAEPLYVRALDIDERVHGRQHHETAITLNDLAGLYASSGRLAQAETILRRVLHINAHHFGKDSSAAGVAMSNLGAVLQRRNRLGHATSFAVQALAVTKKALGAKHINTAYVLGALAQLRFAKQQYAAADALTREALHIFESNLSPNAIQIGRANYFLSRCALKRGRTAEALDYAMRAATTSRNRRKKDDAEIFLQVIRASYRAARLSEAFEAAELYIANEASAAVEHMALRFALGSSPLAALLREQQQLIRQHDLMDRQHAVALGSIDPATRAQSTSLRKRLDALDTRARTISARLQREHPPYSEYVAGNSVTLNQAQALLKRDEVLVLIISVDDGTYVFAVSREQSAWHRASLTNAQISKHVSVLRSQLDPNQWQGSFSPFDRQRAHLLYRHLWHPIAPVLAHKSTVFVIQSGSLSSLPPSALITSPPKGGTAADSNPADLRDTPWLAKRHALVSVPSLSSFKALRSLSASPSGSEPFAGFGNPVNTLRSLPALPFAVRELRSLAKSMGASVSNDVYLGSQATETQLKTLDLSRKRVIAFATHALTASQFGTSEPGLVLSTPKQPGRLDDGYLSASEAAQLNLRADWIILSACNTAAGASPGAEGLSGLARAFFYAGARSILVSNWPVWDDTAERLTTATVAQFQKYPRQGRAAALHQAMLSLMQDTANPRFAHPATWASFALVGDAQAR